MAKHDTPETAPPDEQSAPQTDSLSTYRAKRSADTSPEPVGHVAATEGRLFVVHKHAATRLHWDLRIEMEGVLRSWAVPKGPSYDPQDKRLAVRVEDHPLEYGDFEGIIPAPTHGPFQKPKGPCAGALSVHRQHWLCCPASASYPIHPRMLNLIPVCPDASHEAPARGVQAESLGHNDYAYLFT